MFYDTGISTYVWIVSNRRDPDLRDTENVTLSEDVFKPPRPLAEIDADVKVVTDRIVTMIGELSK